MELVKTIGLKIKDLFHKLYQNKKIFWGVLGALAIVVIILVSGNKEEFVIQTIQKIDLKRTVSATGQVTSVTDLDLSFTGSGIVKNIRVAVGDKVYSGQILATLDQGSALATLTSAQGSLKAAQAKYQKISEGSSNEEIAVAETALRNAEISLVNTKREQDILIANAHNALLNNDLEAIISANNSTSNTAPTISGTYTGMIEGRYTISTYYSGSGGYFSVSGLSSGSGLISTSGRTAVGAEGLYVQFPSGFNASSSDIWVVDIPNKKSSSYVTYLNTYIAALETRTSIVANAQAVVDTKTAELNLKRAKARTVELDLAEADVISAQGQVQSAQAVLENTILRAPASGTITSIDIKLGELAQATKPVMVLQDVGSLYVEAKINESDITRVLVGQPVTMTLDAFGPDIKIVGSVVSVDPAAVTDDGVVNYEIKISLPADMTGIRPGMNANVTIITGEKQSVIALPQAAIETNNNLLQVKVMTDPKRGKTILKDITTGFVGDGNMVEITSGIAEGDVVVIGVK